jgi:hypothetical protein
MLSSHSRIYIPPETDFIPYFFNKNPNETLTPARVQAITNEIFSRYRFVEEWQGEEPTNAQLLARMANKTPAGYLNALYSMYAEQNGATRWGDKTPIYASYLGLLHQIFPTAKFIHIIRDPFDASISLLDKYEAREMHIDPYFAARNWVRRIQHAQRTGKELRNLYYEMRYEDLVKNPEQEIREVCQFLDEDFEPAMLTQHKLAQNRIEKDSHFFANVRNPINTQSLGRGRRDLSVQRRRIIQRVAKPLMLNLNYPLETLGAMSFWENLRFEGLRIKYGILQFGRSILEAIGLFPPI